MVPVGSKALRSFEDAVAQPVDVFAAVGYSATSPALTDEEPSAELVQANPLWFAFPRRFLFGKRHEHTPTWQVPVWLFGCRPRE